MACLHFQPVGHDIMDDSILTLIVLVVLDYYASFLAHFTFFKFSLLRVIVYFLHHLFCLLLSLQPFLCYQLPPHYQSSM